MDQMINFVTKFLKYLFTVLYEIEKNESGLVDKTKSPLNEKNIRSNSVIIMSNTLFPGRGVTWEFEPLTRIQDLVKNKRSIILNIVASLLKIENLQIKERGILIVRTMMSKLKFKYSLKPKWLDYLKKVIRKGNIPQIKISLNAMHGGNITPLVLKKNPNKLKLNNRTLDEYLLEDVVGDYELQSDVALLSSNGFLKNSVDGGDSDHNSERWISVPGETNPHKRDIEDKKLFRQRLRIEFSSNP